MIRKGSLVMMGARPPGHNYVPYSEYPPTGSLCVVVSNPRETPVYQKGPSLTALKKTVDVLCDGVIFEKCEVAVFIEVKR